MFEAELAAVKQNFRDRQFDLGWNNLQDLRTKVESHFASLSAAEKQQWRSTVDHILHCREHAQELRTGTRNEGSTEGQRDRVTRLLNFVSVI